MFNCNTAVFMSFSNIWLSELVIIKLASFAYSTGLDTSDISDVTFGMSLIYKRKNSVPSKDTWGTLSVTDSHLE